MVMRSNTATFYIIITKDMSIPLILCNRDVKYSNVRKILL